MAYVVAHKIYASACRNILFMSGLLHFRALSYLLNVSSVCFSSNGT